MAKNFYEKFTQKSNAAIKEAHKQAKRQAKKERAAAINQRFEEKRALRAAQLAAQAAAGEKPSTGKKGKVHVSNTPAPVIQRTEKLEAMPLNKFLAHCGIASRRDAVTIIKEGKATVNGAVVLDPAFKVSGQETILYQGKQVRPTKNLVYILLNKPKDYLTTTDDPDGRKTVLQLIRHATTERVYPIGRLDRNTSGVLLLTNDGDLTQQLSHPSYQIAKVYEAKLDKPLTKAHFDAILAGITLEDGPIHADSLAYADARDKSVIGIEIHSGKNRIVRRIFEHLGYDVKGLDRVLYAGLTKKNVDRGKWRFLSEKEVRLLKYMNAGKGRKKANAEAPSEMPASPAGKEKRMAPKKTGSPRRETVRDEKPKRASTSRPPAQRSESVRSASQKPGAPSPSRGVATRSTAKPTAPRKTAAPQSRSARPSSRKP